MRFFAIFLSLEDTFSLKLNTMIACDYVLHLVYVKLTKKKIRGPKFGLNGAKSGSKLDFLPSSQVLFIGFPLDYIG